MRHIVLLVAVVGCGGANKEAAEQLSVSTGGVGLAATKMMLSLDELERETQRSKLSRDRGPGLIKYFVAVSTSTMELTKALTNQKRIAVEGDLKACTDAWYPAADALKDALDPFVAVLLKGDSGADHKLEDYWNMRIAWSKVEKDAVAKLCDLRKAGTICGKVFEDASVAAPGTKTMGLGSQLCKT